MRPLSGSVARKKEKSLSEKKKNTATTLAAFPLPRMRLILAHILLSVYTAPHRPGRCARTRRTPFAHRCSTPTPTMAALLDVAPGTPVAVTEAPIADHHEVVLHLDAVEGGLAAAGGGAASGAASLAPASPGRAEKRLVSLGGGKSGEGVARALKRREAGGPCARARARVLGGGGWRVQTPLDWETTTQPRPPPAPARASRPPPQAVGHLSSPSFAVGGGGRGRRRDWA